MSHRKTMSKLPIFYPAPILRCFCQLDPYTLEVCGRPAVAVRQGPAPRLAEFVCARHARPADLPLAANEVFRRVRLSLTVDFAAVSWPPAAAHAEAVDRLNRAVLDAGGLVNLVGVTSAVGRRALKSAAPGTSASPVDPEHGQ